MSCSIEDGLICCQSSYGFVAIVAPEYFLFHLGTFGIRREPDNPSELGIYEEDIKVKARTPSELDWRSQTTTNELSIVTPVK